MSDIQAELERLHQQLHLRRLNPAWAKAEILLGLASVSTGHLCSIYGILHFSPTGSWGLLIGSVLLQTLGGYLALAGHRSHLYQSQNKLAAWLASRAGPDR